MLALALLAAERLASTEIHLFDTRALDRDISGDARTLARWSGAAAGH